MWKKFVGFINTTLQWGFAGPKQKVDSGKMQFRNAADDDFIIVEAKTPTGGDGDNAVATKAFAEASGGAGAIKCIRVPIALIAVASSDDIPADAKVLRRDVEITTAYDNAPVITIGSESTAALLENGSNIDVDVIGTYSVEEETAWESSGETLNIAITNSPTVGAGVVRVWYTEPNS